MSDSTHGDIPLKGRRYRLRSRPWDMSYLEIKEDPNGDWVYNPTNREQGNSADGGYTCHCGAKVFRGNVCVCGRQMS